MTAFKKVSFIISKAIALQLDYKPRLHKTQKTTNIMKIAKKTPDQ